jgi:hypothetical protein
MLTKLEPLPFCESRADQPASLEASLRTAGRLPFELVPLLSVTSLAQNDVGDALGGGVLRALVAKGRGIDAGEQVLTLT